MHVPGDNIAWIPQTERDYPGLTVPQEQAPGIELRGDVSQEDPVQLVVVHKCELGLFHRIRPEVLAYT